MHIVVHDIQKGQVLITRKSVPTAAKIVAALVSGVVALSVISPASADEAEGVIARDAVSMTTSSSEHSQDSGWYWNLKDSTASKPNWSISAKNAQQPKIDLTNVRSDDSGSTIVVNDQKSYQSITGMGTSVDGSTVGNWWKMDEAHRRSFIKTMLDPVNGMGLNSFRLTIGTSDFTDKNFYTYYDAPNASLNGAAPNWDGDGTNGFSIQQDRDEHIIDFAHAIQQQAAELGVDVSFFASPWTAPGWMKTPTASSQSYPDNSLLLKGGDFNSAYTNDYAKYLVRYVEEYSKEGIPISALTLQNEPLLEINYPSNHMTGTQEVKLATAIKSELTRSTVLNASQRDVKVWAYDHNFDGADAFVAEMKQYPEDWKNVDGLAFHPYGGVPATMGALAASEADKSIHLTERSWWGTTGANWMVDWFRNGSQSYNSWVSMLDSQGKTHHWVGTPDPTPFIQNAADANDVVATPEVYLTSQFSRYVRPGDVRIDSTNGSAATLTNVAFKNPRTGVVTMVVVNQSDKEQSFTAVNNGAQFVSQVPAKQVATYQWSPIDGSRLKDITSDISLADANLSGGGEKSDNGITGLDESSSVEYLVNVRSAGTYKVRYKVKASREDAQDVPISIANAGGVLGTAHYSAANAEASTTQTFITLNKGIQSLKLAFPKGGVDFLGISFEVAPDAQPVPGQLGTGNYADRSGIAVVSDNAQALRKDAYLDYVVDVTRGGKQKVSVEGASDGTGAEDGGIDLYTVDAEGGQTPVGSRIAYGKNAEVELAAGRQTIRVRLSNSGDEFGGLLFGNAVSVSQPVLRESSLKGAVVEVTLLQGAWSHDLDTAQWRLTGAPSGVEYTVARVDDTHAQLTFTTEADVDFDSNITAYLNVSSSQYDGTPDDVLRAPITFTAIDDPETLSAPAAVAYRAGETRITIDGGTFNSAVTKKNATTLSGEISKYVSIASVEVSDPHTLIVKLQWSEQAMYGDLQGDFTLAAAAYDDSDDGGPLHVALRFTGSDEKPSAIALGDSEISLGTEQNKPYRGSASLSDGATRGDYQDYYLDVPQEGDYVVTFSMWDNGQVPNAFKISGGMGLATDNLASISIPNLYNGFGDYKLGLHLAKGQQTLRFELNAEGASMWNLRIKPSSVSQIAGGSNSSTITPEDVDHASTDKVWGIQGSNPSNIGWGEVGSYQDYEINVDEGGVYDIAMEAASGGDGAIAHLQVLDGGTVGQSGELTIPNTGWDGYGVQKLRLTLNPGRHTLRVTTQGTGINYRSLVFTLAQTLETIPVSDKAVALGEDKSYDHQGSLEHGPVKGNYQAFYLDVANEGDYTLDYGFWSNGKSVPEAITISGSAMSDTPVSFPTTGAPATTGARKTLVHLKEGKQTLRVSLDAENVSVWKLNLQPVAVHDIGKVQGSAGQVRLQPGDAIGGSNDKGWGIRDASGDASIAWGDKDSYQEYRVDAANAGRYQFSAKAATATSGAALILSDVAADGSVTELTRVTVPNYGDASYSTTALASFELGKGVHTLRVSSTVPSLNSKYVNLTLLSDAEPTPEPPKVDTAALQALVQQAEQLQAPEGKRYTEASKQALDAAIAAGKSTLGNKDVTQAEVDAAADSLRSAIDGMLLEDIPGGNDGGNGDDNGDNGGGAAKPNDGSGTDNGSQHNNDGKTPQKSKESGAAGKHSGWLAKTGAGIAPVVIALMLAVGASGALLKARGKSGRR